MTSLRAEVRGVLKVASLSAKTSKAIDSKLLWEILTYARYNRPRPVLHFRGRSLPHRLRSRSACLENDHISLCTGTVIWKIAP